MASKSSSQSQQQQPLTRASKVHFKCGDGIIAYNNAIALLENQNDLYQPMLQFLSNSCIATALTIQPSINYLKYLRNSGTVRRMERRAENLMFAIQVAKLLTEPEETLILSSGKVNADDIADKSLSRTTLQPVTQSKAPTYKKSKRKKIPSSSKPKTSNIVRESSSKKQVVDTQPVEEIMATADTTLSLDASESIEEQGNQLKPVDATKRIRLVVDAFEERIPKLLSDTLKNILPQIIKDSVKQALPKFDKRVKKTLADVVPEINLKPLNKEFNALNVLESRRFDKRVKKILEGFINDSEMVYKALK
ncbi:hypothetical protein Tco_0841767 [Tanacetum coccineum]|uniref:Uncharacterized protein n=1 Tax=Tanacetum coccineum TaxID=301880 RepID=A0ABQ5AXE9_9ASTR